jgi:hypothetical protein
LEIIMLKQEKTQVMGQRPGPPQVLYTPNIRNAGPLLGRNPVEVLAARKAAAAPVASSRGLCQMFGLDPRVAFLTVLIDAMVFGADTFSMELLLPLGIGVAVVLGIIVYLAQMKWYGDDKESALIKALIIFVLTAIPVPLGPFVAVPGGLIGIAKKISGK